MNTNLPKVVATGIASGISYLALTAIFTTPVFFNNHIKNYYWFSGMMLGFLISILIIFKSYNGVALRKKTAIFIAFFIGIVFSTYLDSFLNTSVLIAVTNSVVAVILGTLFANTDSKYKREDLLIFMWCYVPIKFITIIALLKGAMLVKINSPFISFFIMGIVFILLRQTFNKCNKSI